MRHVAFAPLRSRVRMKGPRAIVRLSGDFIASCGTALRFQRHSSLLPTPDSLLPAFVAMTFFAAVVQSGDSRNDVSGRVVSDDSSAPLDGVRVGIRGTSDRVVSDENGRFRLRAATDSHVRITGWKPGYFIAGASRTAEGDLELRMRLHPAEDSPEYQWVDPGPDPAGADNCANCHGQIYRQWSVSSHARASVNRHFLNTFYGTDWLGNPEKGWNFRRDQPDARAVCSACHLPTVTPADPSAESPALAAGVTREGIHCDFCHKIRDTEFAHSHESLGLQHGRDAFQFVRPANGPQVFFGPLDDVDRGHDTYVPLYRSSAYCASCHEGTLFGMRVYETYSEWLASAYRKDGIECQSCHMKPDGKTRNIAPDHGGADRHPASLSTHQFPGSTDDELLRSSLELSLTGTRDGSSVRAAVRLRPIDVGHRLPTGSPDRHLILVVRATDEQDAVLALVKGPTVSAAGGIGERDAGNFGGMPGKLYGKIFRGSDGSSPAPFWRSVAVESDTRLLPDMPDESEYVFERGDSGGAVTLGITVLYRRFYKAVSDEKSWPADDRVIGERRVVLRAD
jgi:hypothetical protein